LNCTPQCQPGENPLKASTPVRIRLEFLRAPPANCLEALIKDRKGQHSIRVNDQFRVCFRWTATGPEDVEIVDYH
jgi:toxin HigB-1